MESGWSYYWLILYVNARRSKAWKYIYVPKIRGEGGLPMPRSNPWLEIKKWIGENYGE